MDKVYIGKKPMVVGVVSRAKTLLSIDKFIPFDSDMIEVRLDIIGGDVDEWAAKLDIIEASGTPVILTIRGGFEGGKWTGTDEARLPLFEKVLSHVSFVDIEYRSTILGEVSSAASERGKGVIISFHDFDKTPDIDDLKDIISKISKIDNSVAKIATRVNSQTDVETLKSLLGLDWGIPLCVIGMGDDAGDTRISFPLLGSSLTYGYIDEPSAPGQPSARDLKREIDVRIEKGE